MPKHLLICGAVLCLAACTTPVPRDAAPTATPTRATAVVVPERYVSADDPRDELDSLATWPTEDGHTWLIATAKSTHALVVFDADSGERLRSVGGKGAGAGQFLRPNGIAVFGDRVFVAERDNHRVQVLSLPEFAPLGEFGADALRAPYGLWIDETGPDEYDVYVTDSFMEGEHHDRLPPFEQLDRRVHRYHLAFDAEGRFTTRDDGTFGDTSEAAALRIVESIAGDPAQKRLLIADEYTSGKGGPDDGGRRASNLREYTFDGRPTGRELPTDTFEAEAEGVALWSCSAGAGYWIAADQRYPLTHFLLFDRDTLAPRGAFVGGTVAHTDGIALHAATMATFPSGALFAVHDDKAVAAFDLGEVARALDLDPACTE
jgi:3-phytase